MVARARLPTVTLTFLHPKVWLALAILAAPLSAMSACSGMEFSSTEGSAGAGGSAGMKGAGGSKASGGSGGSVTGAPCGGPEDCNDADPCTIDQCGVDGHCLATPKCGEDLVCCGGDCGECCANSDCDDSIECTNDICFAASCTHVPNDALCGAGEYCAMADGCRPQEPCSNGNAAECDDSNLCTTDSCASDLCQHRSCDTESGIVCCEEFGCGECCVNSQCKDGDACTRDRCDVGKCFYDPLCGDGLECCDSADGATATCGLCCAAGDCTDSVDCTDDTCAAGQCVYTPNPARCGAGQTCSPVAGCQQAAECTDQADCDDQVACTDDLCDQGTCLNAPNNANCPTGQTCSVQLGRCVQCTSAVQCDDQSECTTDTCVDNRCVNTAGACGQGVCCNGKCREQCCSVYDCGVKSPFAPPLDGGSELCSYATCTDGVCHYLSEACKDTCCPYEGCTIGFCSAID